MEIAVFMKLLKEQGKKRGVFCSPGSNRDVGFATESAEPEWLIYLSHRMEKFETARRALRSLHNTSKKLGCKDLLLMTWDKLDIETYKGKRTELVTQ